VFIDFEINNKSFEISEFSIKKLKEEINALKFYIKTKFETFFNII